MSSSELVQEADGRVRLHAFTDEAKAHGYIMVVALLPPNKLAAARQSIKALVMPGQRRLHFQKESDGRRNRSSTP